MLCLWLCGHARLITKFCPVQKCPPGDAGHTYDPGDRLADAHGEVAPHRDGKKCENDLAGQLQRTAEQRHEGLPHALEGVPQDDQDCHGRHERNADVQI